MGGGQCYGDVGEQYCGQVGQVQVVFGMVEGIVYLVVVVVGILQVLVGGEVVFDLLVIGLEGFWWVFLQIVVVYLVVWLDYFGGIEVGQVYYGVGCQVVEVVGVVWFVGKDVCDVQWFVVDFDVVVDFQVEVDQQV